VIFLSLPFTFVQTIMRYRVQAHSSTGNGNPPLSVGASLRQRALNTAIDEINKKTDLHVEIESLVKFGTRVEALNFSIVAQEIPNAKPIESV